MKVIAKLVSGSHLYGTNIEGSDRDFRGVYLPTKEECYLNRVKETIEDGSEEDTTYFSLQRFLDLAAQGQSVAIEMLATPVHMASVSRSIWMDIQNERHRFFTKNMHSFLGYAKSQSSKYSSRIDRLNEVEAIIAILDKYGMAQGLRMSARQMAALKLSEVWDLLPISTNAVKTVNERNTNADKRAYVVCGRELQATVTIEHAHSVLQAITHSYGERVRKAKDGEIEWKALMHAYRVAYQALEIVETGDLKFPLNRAAWLKKLRLGKIDFFKQGLDQKLDDLIIEVQEKMDKSSLPDAVDKKWCDEVILAAYE